MSEMPDVNKPESGLPGIKGQPDPTPRSGAGFFEIRVRGHLDSKWSDWLDGLEASLLEDGEMILRGPIVDQAALIGILNKLNNLNLALISVNQLPTDKERKTK